MRRVRIALAAVAVTAMLIAGYFASLWRQTSMSAPAAKIYLIGYSYFTKANPDSNVFVYPGRGSWLRAQMVLTNEGRASISYGVWGDEPYGWANVKTDRGATNGFLAPRFTGSFALLRPESAAKFWVILPTNALQWECGFDIETASIRERAIWRMLESRLHHRWMSEVFFYPVVRLLPHKNGPGIEVKSGGLWTTNAVESPRNERSALDARAVLGLHIEGHWRDASDRYLWAGIWTIQSQSY